MLVRRGGKAQQLGVVRVTPRASQTSCVQLWPRGSGQEARHWSEHSWNAVGTFCVCMCVFDCVCLCGEALAHRRPTVILRGRPSHEPPPTQPVTPHLTLHYLTPCALWPGMSSPSTLHKHTHTRRMHAQTRAHTWLQSNRDAWPPVKRCDGNSE